jgi:putative endonuclease
VSAAPTAREAGAAHERAAAEWLRKAGLGIVARNFTCRHGEIDIVARDGEVLVFVEVRYRLHRDFGGALASVDARKQARIVSAARWYLAQHPREARRACRFDVLALGGTGPYEFHWERAAFDAATD